MKCPECNNVIADNAICCENCKEKLIEQINKLEQLCESNDVESVLLAYGIIKECPLFNEVRNRYKYIWSGSAKQPTVNLLMEFITKALVKYEQDPVRWISEIASYKMQGLYLIRFVKEHLEA